jgi:hypothetical protein
MSPMEMGAYTLAENLGMTVTRLKKEMPMSEYYGWMKYHGERQRQDKAADGDLLSMDEDDMIKGML